MYELEVVPGTALDDAAQIDKIVAEISKDLEVLDAAYKRNIPEQIDTEWAAEDLESWNKYYDSSLQEALAAIAQSATNVRMAVESSQAYSQTRV